MKAKKAYVNKKKIDELKDERSPDVLLEYMQSCCNSEFFPLINLVKSGKFNSIFENVAKKYLIISLVTLIEVCFKKLIKDLIDNSPSNSIKVSSIIQASTNSNVSKGEIAATIFNYQNTNEINKILSRLLECDFFNTVKTIAAKKYWLFIEDDEEEKTYLYKNWNNFLKIFNLRHRLIHTTNDEIEFNIDDIKKLVYATKSFLSISVFMIYAKYLPFEENVVSHEFYKITGFNRILTSKTSGGS